MVVSRRLASRARALISRHTVGSDATGPKTSSSQRSTAGSDSILPGSCAADGRRQAASACERPSPRPVTLMASVSSTAPASATAGTWPDSTPTHGYNPVLFTTKVLLSWSCTDEGGWEQEPHRGPAVGIGTVNRVATAVCHL